MNKMRQFNKTNLKDLRSAINAALKDVGERYGLDIHLGSCKYQSSGATWKLETSILDSDGANKQLKEDFEFYATMRGFDKDDFGKEFTDGHGDRFEITGWLPRRKRYPVQAKNVKTGKTFIFPVNSVLRGLGKTDEVRFF